MRIFLAGLLLFGSSPVAFSAYQQQLIPIIRDVQTSSAPSVSEWKAFVRVADYGWSSYVSLVQVSELLSGHLRWRPASKGVDLSVHNQTIRFSNNSSRASINGRTLALEKPTIKNEDGFWVPVTFFASQAFYRTTKSKLEWPPRQEEPAAIGQQQAVETPIPARRSPLAAHAIKRIVIDPGHGGKDPGAVGPRGTEEKAVNPFLAQELADVLRQDYD